MDSRCALQRLGNREMVPGSAHLLFVLLHDHGWGQLLLDALDDGLALLLAKLTCAIQQFALVLYRRYAAIELHMGTSLLFSRSKVVAVL